jgi:chromosome transmission fidelity protein 4
MDSESNHHTQEEARGEGLMFRAIFTGGSDCLVRIHKANEPDSEPGFHDNHEDAVTSLTCAVGPQFSVRVDRAKMQGSNLITASLDNIARTFSYPGNEYTGYVTRSSGVPIRWVSMDKTGERVAVCSE